MNDLSNKKEDALDELFVDQEGSGPGANRKHSKTDYQTEWR